MQCASLICPITPIESVKILKDRSREIPVLTKIRFLQTNRCRFVLSRLPQRSFTTQLMSYVTNVPGA
ncbi:MAG TPA: hypothetical protein IGS31_20360 [Oscillatoriales cyanobacterium M4454_W2019_049]|nr:hypothetical protein [Oscillatoriales cyanobacterium M4454_W2019_049]